MTIRVDGARSTETMGLYLEMGGCRVGAAALRTAVDAAQVAQHRARAPSPALGASLESVARASAALSAFGDPASIMAAVQIHLRNMQSAERTGEAIDSQSRGETAERARKEAEAAAQRAAESAGFWGDLAKIASVVASVAGVVAGAAAGVLSGGAAIPILVGAVLVLGGDELARGVGEALDLRPEVIGHLANAFKATGGVMMGGAGVGSVVSAASSEASLIGEQAAVSGTGAAIIGVTGAAAGVVAAIAGGFSDPGGMPVLSGVRAVKTAAVGVGATAQVAHAGLLIGQATENASSARSRADATLHAADWDAAMDDVEDATESLAAIQRAAARAIGHVVAVLEARGEALRACAGSRA